MEWLGFESQRTLGFPHSADSVAKSDSVSTDYRDRRANYASNTKRMIRAQKLSGMTLAMSYYSDYSEVRFRKLLISNIDYSNFQLSDFETPSPEDPSDNTDISWNELIPKKVNVDPFLKCASSWAVAVTTYMYMKYKQADPLWTVSQNHFD